MIQTLLIALNMKILEDFIDNGGNYNGDNMVGLNIGCMVCVKQMAASKTGSSDLNVGRLLPGWG